MVSYSPYLGNFALICDMAKKLKLLQIILRMIKEGKKNLWRCMWFKKQGQYDRDQTTNYYLTGNNMVCSKTKPERGRG